ncbi:MAG: hypothetical protein A3F17_07375 [Gammaproteobacteria bacterium RIFCSPHIGHO2_12_FULL_41_15]|nr:MAG: hypothetical protein A3F17_07375 [Gammaproteobacteria bacterium RIFCSPHIGHO2_12_FULL_41_15]
MSFKTGTCLVLLLSLCSPVMSLAWVKGIYVTQPTMESSKNVRYLVENAKAFHINTFVVDFYRKSSRYQKNIAMVKANGIRYVARIVMFPDGALDSQIKSETYLERRYQQIREAISLGADVIQLDYIRYRPTQRPSRQNAENIYKIVQQVETLLQGTGVLLEMDIFGVAAHKEALAIGQNAVLFAKSLHAICPMVYPSHYEPFRYHATRPYETVYSSLVALRQQLAHRPDVKVHAYIELYNYRYPLSRQNKINYILAELRAVRDAQADGWYAWSANNKYSLLFAILRAQNTPSQ